MGRATGFSCESLNRSLSLRYHQVSERRQSNTSCGRSWARDKHQIVYYAKNVLIEKLGSVKAFMKTGAAKNRSGQGLQGFIPPLDVAGGFASPNDERIARSPLNKSLRGVCQTNGSGAETVVVVVYVSRIRWRRRGNSARPYICRLRSLTFLWNQICQASDCLCWLTARMGSRVAVAGMPIWRGVDPAGVGTSARRSRSWSRAV